MAQTILITGSNGEIGHGLIKKLSENSENKIVALDLVQPQEEIKNNISDFIQGNTLDSSLIETIFNKYSFDKVFHLAALLSTASEKDPVKAHHVNTDGAINILYHSEKFSRENKRNIVFVFPSSIAVYGIPDVDTSRKIGKVKEEEFNKPATMYGCNKLYIELLGNYYQKYYKKDEKAVSSFFSFRCIRFPGIISADTLPTGGTSDFGPEILHAAAQGKTYECFVRPDTKIPFMVMPDAVKALINISDAPLQSIKQYVYNVGAFSLSAQDIAFEAKKFFGKVDITYKPDIKRQAIVDSWPEDVNDDKARNDWGWQPDYDAKKAFEEYLIPSIKARYGNQTFTKV